MNAAKVLDDLDVTLATLTRERDAADEQGKVLMGQLEEAHIELQRLKASKSVGAKMRRELLERFPKANPRIIRQRITAFVGRLPAGSDGPSAPTISVGLLQLVHQHDLELIAELLGVFDE